MCAWSQTGLPFASGSQSSYRGALHAAHRRGVKLQRLLRAYAAAGQAGLLDEEAAALCWLPRSSVCSLRGAAMDTGLVWRVGERIGGYRVRVNAYALTTSGQAALAAQETAA